MKSFRVNRAAVLLTTIALLLAVAVGGTVAYLAATTGEVINTFTPTAVDISVDEKFDGNIKEEVSIKNVGNIPAYIRATVVITWQDENGNVYGIKPYEDIDYNLIWNSFAGDWTAYQTDSVLYHKDVVMPGENTSILIDNCAAVNGRTPEGYSLHVEILAQAIQATPTSVVEEVWGVQVVDGKISK